MISNPRNLFYYAKYILLLLAVFISGINQVYAAGRSVPFNPGETIDPGTDSEPCGPLDANCFPSVSSSASTTLLADNNTFTGINVFNSTSTFVGKVTVDGVAIKSGSTITVCSSTSRGKNSCDYLADGTSDNVEINAALVAGIGGKVVLLEGIYYVTDRILVPSNTTLQGQGKGTQIFLVNGVNPDWFKGGVVQNSNSVTGNTGVVIRDLFVDGNRTNNTVNDYNAIALDNASSSSIINTWAARGNRGGGGTDGNGICLNGSLLVVSGNHVFDNDYDGIKGLDPLTYSTIADNVAYDNFQSGIQLATSGSDGFNTITGNNLYNNTGVGLMIHSSNHNTVVGNEMSNNPQLGVKLIGTSMYNLFSGNHITRNLKSGVRIHDGSDENIFVGNVINENASVEGYGVEFIDGGDKNKFQSNTIAYNSGTGVRVVTGIASDGNIFTDNIIHNNTGAGIYLPDTNSTNFILNNNIVYGNTVAQTLNSGSGTVISGIDSTGNLGIGSTTPGTLLSLGNTGNDTINISPTATSTFGSGINIRTGCFSVNGVCVGGGSSYGDTNVNSYIHASTTIPKTYTANTWTGANTFNSTLTVSTLNGPLQANNGVVSATTSIGVLYGGTGLTSIASSSLLVGGPNNTFISYATSSLGLVKPSDLNSYLSLSSFFGTTTLPQITTLLGVTDLISTRSTTTNATSTNLYLSGKITGAGLTSCSGSGDKLIWNSTTQQFSCGADAGAGGGLTALAAQYSSFQSGSSQTFATSSDTNLNLTITSSGDVHTFTPSWTGTLAVNRGGTGQTSFGQGWLNSNGTTLTSSTSPTVNYITATSTTATSTFAGAIGIGTASPYRLLEIVGPTAGAENKLLQLRANGSTDSTAATMKFVLSTVNSADIGAEISAIRTNTDASGDSDLVFRTSATAALVDRMILKADGKIGLGTTSPAVKVTISGSDTTTSLSTLNAGSALSIVNTNQTVNNFEGIYFRQVNSAGIERTSASILAINTSHTSGSESGDLSFGTRNSGTFSEKVILKGSGSVGIGTTTPYAKLSVVGPVVAEYIHATSTTATSTFAGGLNVAGSLGLTVLQNGNVGVGKINPEYKLDISGSFGVDVDSDGIREIFSNSVDDNNLLIGGNSVIDDNPAIEIVRNVLNTTKSAHGITDSTTIDNGRSYASFSTEAIIANNASLDYSTRHLAMFQANAVYQDAGNIDAIYGLTSTFTNNGGDVGNYYGVRITSPAGSGTYTNKYGLYSNRIYGGTGDNYQLFLEGTTGQSYLGGKIGVNKMSPDNELEIKSTAVGSLALTVENTAGQDVFGVWDDGTGDGQLYLYNSSGVSNIILNSNGNSYFNNGNLGIGTTTPWKTLSVVGAVAINGLTANSGSNYAVCINNTTKEITADVGGACNPSSSRFKDSIQSLSVSGINIVSQLNPSSFRYLNNDNINYGLIAEEVSKIDVHLATYEEDGTTPHGLDSNALISVLIKAVQEIINKVDGMFTRIDTKTLCLGSTCVTEEQLKALLLRENIAPATYTQPIVEVATTTATTTPVVDSVSTTTSAVIIPDTSQPATTTPVVVPTETPVPTVTETPIPSPTPTPTPSPEVVTETPTPTPEPVLAPEEIIPTTNI